MTEQQRAAMQQALEQVGELRIDHYTCEDKWYSCPKSEEGCANQNAGDECDCGADKHNEMVSTVQAALRAALAEPEQSPEDAGYVPLSADGKHVFIDGIGEVPLATGYRSCPTHCCPVHGCKYGFYGCPVHLGHIKPEYPHNNGCEYCESKPEPEPVACSQTSSCRCPKHYSPEPEPVAVRWRWPGYRWTVEHYEPGRFEARYVCSLYTTPPARRQHAEIESLRREREEDQCEIRVWRRRTDQAEAECDALRADAERYRWLRVRNELPDGVDPSGPFVVIGDDGNVDYPSGAKLDAAIDAAREAGK